MKPYAFLARLCGVAGLMVASLASQADAVQVVDDLGRTIRLDQPARRIISLAPHITENLFSAGAGAQVVGAVEYSDYPAAARAIPRVGNAERFNLEAIIQLQPDLIIGWASGNGLAKLEQIIALGYPVYLTEPDSLDDIARTIARYGKLSGQGEVAGESSRAFAAQLQQLRQTFQHQAPVALFYQVWNQPLHTVSGTHLISQVMTLCGGRNVFAELQGKAPQITLEAVLAADPEVIVASGMDAARPEWLDDWAHWQHLQAVQNNNLYFIPPDHLQRHTRRLLLGAETLCQQLSHARQKRDGY